jgi:hypothetical protein
MTDLKFIKKFVERELGIKDLTIKSNKPEYVFARFVAYYLARKYTNRHYADIAFIIGHQRHANALYGERKIKKYLTAKKANGELLFKKEAGQIRYIEAEFERDTMQMYEQNKIYCELEKSFKKLLDRFIQDNEREMAERMKNGIEAIYLEL